MAGYCSWNTRSTSASTPLHSEGVAPTRTRPRASPTISATATRAPSASARIRRANGSTARPAAVSVGPSRAPRSTRGAPSSSSSTFSWRDNVGCATPTSSAARVKLRTSATARKYLSCCNVTAIA